MIQRLIEHTEMRRILILLGIAGICAIVGAGIYAAAMHAVTPTRTNTPVQYIESPSGSAPGPRS